MTFDRAYDDLESEFKDMVKEEKVLGFESIFLPNRKPKQRVDFVLVGMEPSLRPWAKNLDHAKKRIKEGFRNFQGCVCNSILHFCIETYLNIGRESYYLTDLAQGAMKRELYTCLPGFALGGSTGFTAFAPPSVTRNFEDIPPQHLRGFHYAQSTFLHRCSGLYRIPSL